MTLRPALRNRWAGPADLVWGKARKIVSARAAMRSGSRASQTSSGPTRLGNSDWTGLPADCSDVTAGTRTLGGRDSRRRGSPPTDPLGPATADVIIPECLEE